MVSNKSRWPLFRVHFLERPACCKYMPWARWAIKWARVHDTMFLKIRLPHPPALRGLGKGLGASNANSPGDQGRAEGALDTVTSNIGCTWAPSPEWQVRPLNLPYAKTVKGWWASWSTDWNSGYSEQKSGQHRVLWNPFWSFLQENNGLMMWGRMY